MLGTPADLAQQLGAADDLVEAGDAKAGENVADFLGDELIRLMTFSGEPENFSRSRSSCEQTPTGRCSNGTGAP